MSEKTLDELAVDMYTREDALPHLMAKAEVTRRLTVAQLDAAKATIETRKLHKAKCSIHARIGDCRAAVGTSGGDVSIFCLLDHVVENNRG